jgi:hypothetical protein
MPAGRASAGARKGHFGGAGWRFGQWIAGID